MTLYTVHVPNDGPDGAARADRTVFIREGFSRTAFVFGVLYLLWHRLWLAAAIWIVASLLLIGGAVLLHLPGLAVVALSLLMRSFIGLEAHDLRRARLSRRHFDLADIIAAGHRDDAERAFFRRHLFTAQPTEPGAGVPVRAQPRVMREAPPQVIGMFPEENG